MALLGEIAKRMKPGETLSGAKLKPRVYAFAPDTLSV